MKISSSLNQEGNMRYVRRMTFLQTRLCPVRHTAMACALSLLLSGCLNKPADISGYLDRAKQQFAEGHLDRAKLELQQAVKLRPNDPNANFQLARIEDANGDLTNAVPHYLRASVPEARILDAQLRVIEILLDSGRYADALGRINTTLGSYPTEGQALALRADLEERQNDDTAARNDASAVLQRDPTNARAIATTALLELKNKNGQRALALVQKGLAAHPKDLRLLQVQAASLLTLDQPNKAVDALQTIVTISPRNIAAQFALADIEAQNGHVDTALTNLKNAVTADPSNQELKLGLVNFLARQRKDADLVAYLGTQIAQEPKSSVYDLLLAEYERDRGNLAESRSILDAASTRLGTSSEGDAVRVALAKVVLAQGDVRDATARLNQVLSQDPQNRDALLTRAVIEMDNGQSAAAIADALSVTRADPVNARAYEVLAAAYMQFDQPMLAIGAMRRAIAVVPGDDRAQMRLATFLQTAGDLNGAREIAARITQSHPNDGPIWTTAAQLAYERHDWDAATTAVSHLRDIPGMAATGDILSARIAAARGEPAKAAAAFRAQIEKASDLDPGIIGAFASASVAAKQGDDASNFLRAKIPAFNTPNKVAAWASIMAMQADSGHFDAAIAAHGEAAKLVPTDLSVLRTYVRILLSQRDYDRALAAITAAEKAGASPEACATLMGNINEVQGNQAAAEANYKRAYEANPVSVSALNNYASVATDRETKDLTLLDDLRQKFNGFEASNDVNLTDTIAWLDYRLNKLDEAKSLLTRVKADQSANPQLRFHAAAVMLASGDKDRALALFGTIKGQTFPGMDEARTLAAM